MWEVQGTVGAHKGGTAQSWRIREGFLQENFHPVTVVAVLLPSEASDSREEADLER